MSSDRMLIRHLFEIEAVKFGNFSLKSGLQSPIYIDLRMIVSYPNVLRSVAEAIWGKIRQLKIDCLCGVPYTALPIATAISLRNEIPMVMRRKENKDYGTKRMIEGKWKVGQICVVIEDLVTSGSSVLETIDPLEKEGMKVKDVAVLIDRQQGGRQHLQNKGYNLHAVFSLPTLIKTLEEMDGISSKTASEVLDYLQNKTL